MITCHNIFNVWPEKTPLLPVRPRDARKLAPLAYLLKIQWGRSAHLHPRRVTCGQKMGSIQIITHRPGVTDTGSCEVRKSRLMAKERGTGGVSIVLRVKKVNGKLREEYCRWKSLGSSKGDENKREGEAGKRGRQNVHRWPGNCSRSFNFTLRVRR